MTGQPQHGRFRDKENPETMHDEPQPHPLRCENGCTNYKVGKYADTCKGEIFPDHMDSAERQYILDWIKEHGCASHTSAKLFTRSRPHPAPQAPIRSMREDEDGHISWQQMNEKALAEHDAAIARKAREKALKEAITLLEKIKEKFGQTEMANGVSTKLSQRFGAARLGVESSIKAIESIRTKPEQPEQGGGSG